MPELYNSYAGKVRISETDKVRERDNGTISHILDSSKNAFKVLEDLGDGCFYVKKMYPEAGRIIERQYGMSWKPYKK